MVSGTTEQGWQYFTGLLSRVPIATRVKVVRQRGYVEVGPTRYQIVSSYGPALQGYDRDTPVLLVGTWFNHDWIGEVRARFTNVKAVEDHVRP